MRRATKRIRRPAAVPAAAPGDAAAQEAWTKQRARGAPLPAWSDHLVELLMTEIQSLQAKAGADSIELSVWSDCGGMSMEMISMQDIQDSIRRTTGFNVTAKLHCFCDKEEACRTFAGANHKPHPHGDGHGVPEFC